MADLKKINHIIHEESPRMSPEIHYATTGYEAQVATPAI
jgi:hypothetical protein